MRLLIYAPGSGGGHFNRILSIIASVHKYYSKIEWFHSSPIYPLIHDKISIPNIKINYIRNDERRVKKLLEIINNCDILLIDSFLFGIDGELEEILNHPIKKVFLFRYTNITTRKYYLRVLYDHPEFIDLILIPDNISYPKIKGIPVLYCGHLIITPEKWSNLGISLELKSVFSTSVDSSENYSKRLKVHLIHLNLDDELEELRKVVQELEKANIDIDVHEYSPKKLIYPGFLAVIPADLIICGGGYNIMAEIIAFNKKAITLPFTRVYDDQFARILHFRMLYPNNIFTTTNEYLIHEKKEFYSKDMDFLEYDLLQMIQDVLQ